MPSLLIVDDDVDAAEILADVLRGEGYQVRIACDGAAGLMLVEASRPDLVLLDVEMPYLSGPDMAYRMFLHNLGQQEIPVVFCSGVMDLPRIAAWVGTPYFLTKPYPLRTLIALVERVLIERTPPSYAALENK